MSLTRQIGLVLCFPLLLALLGGVGIHLWSARSILQAQLQQRNDDSAAALAQQLSQQRGDRAARESVLTARFDGGGYRLLRFVPADGGPAFVRVNGQPARVAPDWFVRRMAVEARPGTARVVDEARGNGALEVAHDPGPVNDELWSSSQHVAAALGALALLAGLLGGLGVLRIQRRLTGVVGQAQALLSGRFVTLPEPQVPELKALTQAMNGMVVRLKRTFKKQALQVEQLRRQADADALTGLSNRGHFLGQFESGLQREDGPDRCGLVLLRLRDLAGVNRTLGRSATDRILCTIADTLRPYSDNVAGCLLGRLNGADFALCLPAGGVALETAQALAAALKAVLPGIGHGIAVALGAIELQHAAPLAEALAAADEALARAEARGPFEVELGGRRADDGWGLGEHAWRQGIVDALAHGRASLAVFPLIDSARGLVHLECPLRLQLQPDGPVEVAARWLPLALRAHLTAEVDARAAALALEAIARDGQPRCVNIAPASLSESGFAAHLRSLLFAAPRVARKLSFEVAESAAVERFRLLQELFRQLRPCGVRLGLEHAGARLARIDRLLDLGLDFIKLDAATTRGVHADPLRLNFVRGSVELLHGLHLQVYAEGVSDADDARALWTCGVDGITGPWASARHADADA